MSRGAFLTLGVLTTILAGILMLEYRATGLGDEKLPLSSGGVPSVTVPDMQTSWLAKEAAPRLADLQARPPFAATRRPPPGPGSATAIPRVALPRLTGVMVGSDDRRVIFAGSADGHAIVLGVGGEIESWRVQSIGNGQATLTGPDGTHLLRPTFSAGTLETGSALPVVPSGAPIIDPLRNGVRPSVAPPKPPNPPQAAR